MDTAIRTIKPLRNRANETYKIPDVYLTVRWSRYLGRDRRILLNWSATLDAMRDSSVPAYRALYGQAEHFFGEVSANLGADMPKILGVLVPQAGMIFRLAELGTFYHIRYGSGRCVIPREIMVGEWEQSPPHPSGKH